MTREINGKRIWIEHGNQYDAANHMPDFGNPYAQPVGYFITSSVVSTAGKHSEAGTLQLAEGHPVGLPHRAHPAIGSCRITSTRR